MILIGENSQKLLSTLCNKKKILVYVLNGCKNYKRNMGKLRIKTVNYHNEEKR